MQNLVSLAWTADELEGDSVAVVSLAADSLRDVRWTISGYYTVFFLSKIQNSINIYPCFWRRSTCLTKNFGNSQCFECDVIIWQCDVTVAVFDNGLILTTACNMIGYIYSSCYYHHQIRSIHLSHSYHIFPWLCASYVCYIIFCHLLHIRSGKTVNLFSLLLCSLSDECKYSETFWLANRTRLFVQYTISLSSLCKFIWRHWTYKMPVRYILSSMWVRLSIFSPLFILQDVWLYVFSLPISFVMIEIIYILCLIIIMKS